MNNEIKFVTPAHNLLLKQGVGGEEHQVHKNKVVSRQASPLATQKKHFTPLDLGCFQTPNVVIYNTTTTTSSQQLEWERNEDSSWRSLLP
jgi:hypothetical protein